jgi:hypothetical protein
MSLPRAQRRLVDTQHAQPVKQVRAKTPVAHRFLQIDVSRGDDPHVDRNRFAPAEPLDLAFLQKAQQARLAFERQVADFVEQQRAAVRVSSARTLAKVAGSGPRARARAQARAADAAGDLCARGVPRGVVISRSFCFVCGWRARCAAGLHR